MDNMNGIHLGCVRLISCSLLFGFVLGCSSRDAQTSSPEVQRRTDALTQSTTDQYLDLDLSQMVALAPGTLELELVARPDPLDFNQHLGWPVAARLGSSTIVAFDRKRSHQRYALDGFEWGPTADPTNNKKLCQWHTECWGEAGSNQSTCRFDADSSSDVVARGGDGTWQLTNLRETAPLADDETVKDVVNNTTHLRAIGQYSDDGGGVVMISETGVWRWRASAPEPPELTRGRISRRHVTHNGALHSEALTLGPRIVEVPLPVACRSPSREHALLAFGSIASNSVGRPRLRTLTSLDAGRSWAEHIIALPETPTIEHAPIEPAVAVLPSGRIALLSRNHNEARASGGSLAYGAMTLSAGGLLATVLGPQCNGIPAPAPKEVADLDSIGYDDYAVDAVTADVDWHGAATNIPAHAPETSYFGMDTADLIFNPCSSNLEAVVTDRNGPVVSGEFSGMRLMLYSLDLAGAEEGKLSTWSTRATLLKRKGAFHGSATVRADGLHPGGSVLHPGATACDGMQHLYLYAGNPVVGGSAAIFELRRTLDPARLVTVGDSPPPDPGEFVPGDFNGDGLTDLFEGHEVPGKSKIHMAARVDDQFRLGARGKWVSRAPLPGFVTYPAPGYRFRNGYRVIAADLDGDGRDDLIRMSNSGNYDTLFLTGGSGSGFAPLFGSVHSLPAGGTLYRESGQYLTMAGAFLGRAEPECLLTMESGSVNNQMRCWNGSTLESVESIEDNLYNSDGSIRPLVGDFLPDDPTNPDDADDRDEVLRMHSQKQLNRSFSFTGSVEDIDTTSAALPSYNFNGQGGTAIVGDFVGDHHLDVLRAHKDRGIYNVLFTACGNDHSFCFHTDSLGNLVPVPNYWFYKGDGTIRTVVGNFGGDAKEDILRLQDDPALTDDRPHYALFISEAASGIGGAAIQSQPTAYYLMSLATNAQIVATTLPNRVPDSGEYDAILRDNEVNAYDLVMPVVDNEIVGPPLSPNECR